MLQLQIQIQIVFKIDLKIYNFSSFHILPWNFCIDCSICYLFYVIQENSKKSCIVQTYVT